MSHANYQALTYLKESPSQTAGPYVHIGCVPTFAGIEGLYPDPGQEMITGDAQGTRIRIEGQVFDGTGTPIRDAMLEIWQADAAGLHNSPSETRGEADPHFTGWGRQPTDGETGTFRFDTVKPGAVPWPDGRMQAPHISVWIVARGINLGLHTRIYFEDEAEANAADPLLARIEHRNRVPTLIAGKIDGGYRFDIHLQGDRETVFFDI
ncbi:protocatechuate 3,4-dioxygenase subunit alpha [Pacificitalea manganoxidans]|uniref:Protocatechuate 3,4-dioxygenase subunit alpha n=1 Tax=Pacificitalea manganoxidans TaxID=1411902 RepID=A0A291M1J7_9RHOB|nr:protocatechuate 3,4-dioxygenase subunit alpha [Pacificitalea manganoxidans]ATI42727.1 protocatechuate 3,4-dioxygenase subunit alpha [Pacificitalea manganoxidans]MDR6307379.1 protocatechuate 3,4-dioxygenase alpha subunit [Pacificitalea manganoxidans]